MSLPAPRRPGHANGRWETVRYALDSNARTFRLCLILFVTAIAPAAACHGRGADSPRAVMRPRAQA